MAMCECQDGDVRESIWRCASVKMAMCECQDGDV